MNQSKIAFFDEVEQRQAAIEIAPGYFDDETQIGLDHTLATGSVTAPGKTPEVFFLIRGQQRRVTDFLQIQLRCIR